MRSRHLLLLMAAVFVVITSTATATAAAKRQSVAPGGFPPGSQTTIGRLWPIFAGERGEYELAAGHSAAGELSAMAASGNDGGLLPEQAWDQNPPSGTGGPFQPGRPTFSATPPAWTHAQLIRLAWSIAAGHPVEQPAIVACRYVRHCAAP